MKNAIIARIILTCVLVSISTMSCQKAAERPAKLSQDLNGNSFEIAQVQAQEQTPESIATLKAVIAKCISLVKNEEEQKSLNEANAKGLLTIQLSEERISLISKIDENKKINTTEQKNDDSQSKSKLSNAGKSEKKYFTLKSFKIKSGILENSRTDYNEKMSVLEISPKKLTESTHFSILEEIQTETSSEQQVQF
ncbi:MAG: hypothetical protein ACK4VO_02895 [Pseudobdellovibrio sp.]